MGFFKLQIVLNYQLDGGQSKPTLPKFTGETDDFSGFLENYTILCILKSEMPFKMHKIIFFSRKKNIIFFSRNKNNKKMCVPTLPKILRPVTRNTFIFFIWPKQAIKG